MPPRTRTTKSEPSAPAEPRAAAGDDRSLGRTAIYNTLRDLILNWELRPGDHLSEVRLSKQFDVSRTPVREALQRLADEGLVRNIPGRGTFVSEMSTSDLIEIFQMRLALEPFCARLAAQAVKRGTAHRMGEIREQILASTELIAQGDAGHYFEVTREMDLHIAQLANNGRLLKALEHVWAQELRGRKLAFTNSKRLLDSVDEHVAIVDAIAAGDAQLAYTATFSHLEAGAESRMAMMLGGPA